MPQRAVRLAPGDHAPDFSVTDIAGTRISLADYRERKVLLTFLRYGGCPFCNLIMDGLAAANDLLQPRGLRIIAFFESGEEDIRQRYGAWRRFPVVVDPRRKIYDRYGVAGSLAGALPTYLNPLAWLDVTLRRGYRQGPVTGDMTLMPAQFLIGPPGSTVRMARYDVTPDNAISFLDLERFTRA